MRARIAIPIVCAFAVLAVVGFFVFRAHSAADSSANNGVKGSQTSNSRPNSNGNTGSSAGSAAAPAFDKTQYSTTDPSSIWVVVNKQHPLSPISYAPGDLTGVGNGQYMRAAAAAALTKMFADAKADGLTLTAASGYRSYSTQVSVYASEVKSYGQTVADSESARPGYSEHQTGLAVDIAGGGCSIEDCFGTTKEGAWVRENGYKYGFLLRYTPEDTATTGYRAEAWHFRYIGPNLAAEMHITGATTLEAFFGITGGSTYIN